MKKYEYKSVIVSMESSFMDFKYDKVIDVINSNAAEGWRYVDFFPRHQATHGWVYAAELIFEREIEE